MDELPEYAIESSDQALLSLLSQRGEMGVAELTKAMGVTATAVRQRLSRLMDNGCIVRQRVPTERGRPKHCYRLSEKGRRLRGSNFIDLAIVLWKEIRTIRDPEIQSGLLQRIAKSFSTLYRPQIDGETTAERFEAVARVFADRNVPMKVDSDTSLPVLTVCCCPYPELAEQDRGICAVERMVFSELVGAPVKLTEDRFSGAPHCRYQVVSN